MTREECELSIVYLEGIKDNYIEGNGYERHPLPEYYAIETAIKALEQQPCEDCISRQAVIDLVADYDLNMGQVVRGIHALPPVTPQPKLGYWMFIKTIFDKHGSTAECSSCHKKWKTYDEIRFKKEHNFCPNCGAEMQEVEE